jgi:hypothetical protein
MNEQLKMIDNRMKIERQINLARESVHSQLVAIAASGVNTNRVARVELHRRPSSADEEDAEMNPVVDRDHDYEGDQEGVFAYSMDRSASDLDDDEDDATEEEEVEGASEGEEDFNEDTTITLSRRPSLSQRTSSSSLRRPSRTSISLASVTHARGDASPIEQRRSEILSRLGLAMKAASSPTGAVFSNGSSSPRASPESAEEETEEEEKEEKAALVKRRYHLANGINSGLAERYLFSFS